MAICIASGIFTTSANTKSSNQITGTYENLPKCKITLVAKASATAPAVTLLVGGVPVVNDQKIPFTGTAGTLSVADNVMVSQVVGGGRAELYFREITGGTPTVDYAVYIDPVK